jgi:hypothetical protein
MSRLEALVRFVWDFIVGDDWVIAAGVVIALGATALVAGTSWAAWWVLPTAVLLLLAVSVWRSVPRP